MYNRDWNITDARFVAYFDILGFKDLVSENENQDILAKLYLLKNHLSIISAIKSRPQFKNENLDEDQTKVVTFSDSIIFFSKGNKYNDALKIVFDAYWILQKSLNSGIAIKCAISFGNISVDFKESLFFGKPIIDAFRLHEELQMLTVILDSSAEKKIMSYKNGDIVKSIIVNYKANLKSGRIMHALFKPQGYGLTKERIGSFNKLYGYAHGKSKLCIDNSIEFLQEINNGLKII